MSFAFLPLYTGDYLRDTQHLSCSEHGIFVKLLMHCWDQRGPVPLDERKQCGIVNARSSDEVEALRRVLGEFFTRMEDGWYNRRMMREVEKAAALSDKKSTAGKLGAAATNSRKRKDIPARAQQLPGSSSASARHEPHTPTPTITPTPTTRTRTTKDVGDAPGFAAFWASYPHFPNRSSKAKSRERWISMKLEPLAGQVMVALRACLDVPAWTKNDREFVCAAEVWLHKRLWQQELIANVRDRLIESIAADPRFADMTP